MSNVTPLVRLPEKTETVAEEFGLALYSARIDPSDPEACFNYLYTHFPERWREALANFDECVAEAGQFYIAAEMSRAS